MLCNFVKYVQNSTVDYSMLLSSPNLVLTKNKKLTLLSQLTDTSKLLLKLSCNALAHVQVSTNTVYQAI